MSFFKKRKMETIIECERKRKSALSVIILHSMLAVVGLIYYVSTLDGAQIDMEMLFAVPGFFASLPLFLVLYNFGKSDKKVSYEELMFWGYAYASAPPSVRAAISDAVPGTWFLMFVLKMAIFVFVMLYICMPWLVVRMIYAVYSLAECNKFMKEQE